MYERFTDTAKKVMKLASQEALRSNHEYIGDEHILLGLIRESDGIGATLLKDVADLSQFRSAVENLAQSDPEMIIMEELPQTALTKKTIERAFQEAQSLDYRLVGTDHLLLGLLSLNEGVALEALKSLDADLDQMRASILTALGNEGESENDKTELRSDLLKKMNNRALHCLSLARNIAVQQKSSILDTQHLLLGILKQKLNDGAFALRSSGIKFEEAEKKTIELAFESKSEPEQSSHRLGMSDEFLLALSQAESIANKVINAEYLTLGLLRPPSDAAIEFNSTKLIKALSAQPKTVVTILSSCMKPNTRTASEIYANSVRNPFEKQVNEMDPVLASLGRNLTLSARFKCDPPIEIDNEVVDRMLSIFLRRNRNNLLLVGGNEKCRSYIESFALTVCDANPAHFFEETQVVEIPIVDLIHDSKFEATFVQALHAARSQTGIILAMPSLLALHKFNSPFRAQYTLLESIHPWLVLPGFRLVGTCRPDELQRLGELPHIISQFEIVRLDDVQLPTTTALIQQQVNKLEDHHLCVYSDSAVSTAQQLCQSLDKASSKSGVVNASIDLLDQAGVDSVLNANVANENVEALLREKLQEFDRELSNLNRWKQTCFEEGNFKTMWQFDFRFEEVLQERVSLQPLIQVEASDVINTFAKQHMMDPEDLKSRLK